MLAYNFTSCLWEWVYLGLFDLLQASWGLVSGVKHRLPEREFLEFYRWSMQLALQGVLLEPQSEGEERQ